MSVSPKPHQWKNGNLANDKHSWGVFDFFLMSSVPSSWRHNYIHWMLHPISMLIFKGHLGINWLTKKLMTSSITLFSRHLFFLTFKNLWNGWTDRGETLHIWHPIHEEQKVHTFDVIGHMVWQPYWIYLKTYKNLLFFSRTAGQIKGKLHKKFPHGMRNTWLLRNNWCHMVLQPYWI